MGERSATNAPCARSAQREEMLTIAPPPAVSTITGASLWLSRNDALVALKAGGHRARAHAGEDGVQGGVAARFRLVARAAGPRPLEPRRAHEPVDDGPAHRLAALQALPDEALGGDPPGGGLPDRRFDGRRDDAGLVRRARRRHAKTFPFHRMWTGTKSESAQGNTLRCRVSFMLTTAMIAALWPQSPCSKARDGYQTMPCRFAGRPSIAGQGEPAPATLRPRTRVWGKRMPGVTLPLKQVHLLRE